MDLIDRVSCELRLTRVESIDLICSRSNSPVALFLLFPRRQPSTIGRKSSLKRRNTARCNVRVTYRKRNVFFMIAHFSIITSSSRPSLSPWEKHGSRNHMYLLRKTGRVSRKREEGGETEGDCDSPSSISAPSFPSRFQKNCRWTDGSSGRFWCVIPMADIELLPARTHQKIERASKPTNMTISHQREERLNSINTCYIQTRTRPHKHTHIYIYIYVYRRHAHTLTQCAYARRI